MAKRQPEHEKEPNAERWLLSYADFITLLMIFFVVMYSMSIVDQNKFQNLAQHLGAVFGNGNPSQIIPKDSGLDGLMKDMPTNQETVELDRVYEEEKKFAEENNLGPNAHIYMDERGLVISLNESLLFDSGSADVGIEAQTLLKTIAVSISKLPNYIRVEGFTDNVPIRTSKFPSNWELASQRAINVAKILVDSGLSSGKVSNVSYGEFRPIVKNDSDANRKLNRRVDIVILKTELNVLEPRIDSTAQ